MNKLGQIAIGLFVVNNAAFDLINISNSTKLNVIFFSVMYFCFLLFCVNEFYRANKEYIRILKGIKSLKNICKFVSNNYISSFSLVMGIGFAVRIVVELTKWPLTWDQYLVSVSDFEKSLLFSFLTIALILIPITNDRTYRILGDDNK